MCEVGESPDEMGLNHDKPLPEEKSRVELRPFNGGYSMLYDIYVDGKWRGSRRLLNDAKRHAIWCLQGH